MSVSRDSVSRMGRAFSLRGRDRIRFLFKQARRRSGENLTVFYDLRAVESARDTQSPDSPSNIRFLVAVPRRTGSAVARNKIRRRLRETFRTWPGRDKLAGDLIVRYNPPSSKAAGRRTPAPLAERARPDRRLLQALSEDLLETLERVRRQIASE